MGNEMVVNSQGLIYPFFIIEFKADGPGGSGSLWAATNQCLGGSASCVNTVERLNCRLRQNKLKAIDNTAFSIAMSGTEARLYVSWKDDELNYYMQKVECFLLQRPDHYLEFCQYIRNIIDWGRDKRLKDIQDSLKNLEDNRKTMSQLAKSCSLPLDDPESSSRRNVKRRRTSKGSRSRKRKASGC
jgi:hypothetical protein